MKQLKTIVSLLLVTAFITSCEKETIVLQENAEINNRKLKFSTPNYPPTDFSEGYILNLSAKNNIVSKMETNNDPCQIINGGFETATWYDNWGTDLAGMWGGTGSACETVQASRLRWWNSFPNGFVW